MALSGREKAAIFLNILGTEGAKAVLRYLPADLTGHLLADLNRLPPPATAAVNQVLDEFQHFVALPEKSEPPPPLTEELLFRQNVKALAKSFAEEHPQTIAFILSGLPAPITADILLLLPELRREVEERMKTLKENQISPDLKDALRKFLARRLAGNAHYKKA